MLRTLSLLTVTVVALTALTACGGRPAHRIKEIEGRNGGLDSLYTFSYDGNTLEEIEIEIEGDRSETWVFTWEGSNLVEFEVERANGADQKHTLTWENGQLVGRLVEEGDVETETALEYEGGRLSKVSLESRINDDRFQEFERTYTYDGSGRLEGIEEDGFTTFLVFDTDYTVTTELSYDDQGRLEGTREDYEYENGSDDTIRCDFKYDDQGRLENLERESTDYTLAYDDQGRVEEVDIEDSWDYDVAYEDGSVNGLSFDLWTLPYGALFDLNGRSYSSFDATTLSFLIGSVD